MKFIPLKATTEFVDVKRGGLVTYGTDLSTADEGIILSNNTEGDYGMAVVDQYHRGGDVVVKMRPLMAPAKKYAIGDLIGYLAVF